MSVYINESRCKYQTGGVNLPGVVNRKRRTKNRLNTVVLNQDRTGKRG